MMNSDVRPRGTHASTFTVRICDRCGTPYYCWTDLRQGINVDGNLLCLCQQCSFAVLQEIGETTEIDLNLFCKRRKNDG